MTNHFKLPRLILVFLSVDWPIFSRRPMIEALADVVRDRGTTVVAVNRPLCPVSTIFRKSDRFGELFAPPGLEKLADNLFLYSPKYVLHDSQSARFPIIQRLNVKALRRSLRYLQRRLGLHEEAPLVWYYSPLQGYVARLFDRSTNIFEIYDSLGDITGRANRFIDRLEVRLRPEVDLLLTTSHVLSDLYSPFYRSAFYFGNGLRKAHFDRLAGADGGGSAMLSEFGRPRLGYCGALSDRLDWRLIMEIAQARPQWQLIFVGPRNGPVPDQQLAAHQNIHILPAVPYAELPTLIKSLDLGILPYLDNAFFQALNPLKFYELAAAGIPCVSSPIPELESFDRRFVRVCQNESAAWLGAATALLEENDGTARDLGNSIASNFLWEDLIARLLRHLESTPAAVLD